MPLLHALSYELESVIIITVVVYDYNYVWVRDCHWSGSTSLTVPSTNPGLGSLYSSLSSLYGYHELLVTLNPCSSTLALGVRLHLEERCIVNSYIDVSTPFKPLCTRMRLGYSFKGTAVFVVGDWGYILFLAAADLVMILRVYAMWNQSKKVLAILLFIYAPEIIFSIVWECIYNNTNGAVSVSQLFNYKSCKYSLEESPPQADRAIPRFVLGVALLILSLIPTLRHMVAMYKFTKRWETNRLMKLLVREGAVYFVVNLYFNIITAITLPLDPFMTFLNALAYSLSCTIMPRFIISIRASYDRDLLSRQQGSDTGFGLFSHRTADGNAAWSAIAFADVTEQGRTLERDTGDSRTIQFDALGDHLAQEFLASVAGLYGVRMIHVCALDRQSPDAVPILIL
ncbi:hypothetical protein HD554DRAFT_2036981 [Boletus coccyginus]|nr:hypothetical protein HD554DRAFT_2042641 [Boletus coccyginus]KAI9571082.1 hypothetical protein HD554DRAFT_2036981 [Boletus coccyginus]